jgi:hypothetical protein
MVLLQGLVSAVFCVCDDDDDDDVVVIFVDVCLFCIFDSWR